MLWACSLPRSTTASQTPRPYIHLRPLPRWLAVFQIYDLCASLPACREGRRNPLQNVALQPLALALKLACALL